jgi:hypothetical protein
MKKILLASVLSLPFCASAQQITGMPTATPSTLGASSLAHPGYVAGNWYPPSPGGLIANSGWANPGANEVVCSYGYVQQQLTIVDLAAFIVTASAGGNVQFAIYNNGSWGRPSSLVVSSASLSTTSTGVQGVVANAQIGPGGYWFCDNFDNATAAIVTYNNTQGIPQALIGSATAANIINATIASSGIKVAQTFGTWPTFTSGTAWADATSAIAPDIIFKVGSVP